MRGQRTMCLCAAAVLLSACAGNGEGLDENGRPIGEANDPLIAEFASIQRHVFTPLCTGCHSGAAAPVGLRLDEGAAFAMLVGAPSVEVPSLNRVQPGNPDASYLIRKLEGTAAVGARMPLNAPPLPPDTIAVIRQWIVNGASPPTSTANQFTDTHPKLEVVWPVSNMPLLAPPPEILLSSNAELDATLLTAGTVSLYRTSPDKQGDTPLDVAVAVRSLSPTVFAVVTPTDAWLPGAYELRVSGTPPLALTDLNSRAIDGNDDGEVGGDLVVRFVLEQAQ